MMKVFSTLTALLLALTMLAAPLKEVRAQAPGEAPYQVAECIINVESWDTLNVRSGPGTKYRILFAIPPDACGIDVDWNDCRGRWCRIWYGGRSGWAHTRYIG